MAEYYLALRALHVIAFISWMAGLLYLPRIYVYHAGVPAGSETDKIFQTMEYRLLKYIMNPAMIATFLFGGAMVHVSGALAPGNGWLHAKLALALALAGFHGLCGRWRKDFARGKNARGARFYRIANEIPTLLMIGIVLLAVLKPF